MPKQTVITLPHNYTPRDYQLPVLQAFDCGFRRFVTVWHRRSGKDKTFVNLMARATMQRVGSYFYFFPTYAQGKKILWDGMDASGFRFLHHFPREFWAGPPNSTEMKLRLAPPPGAKDESGKPLETGSLFQVVGTDNIDSILGSNPIGCVFSEYALQDPTGWEFIRPILRENGGWAAFDFTPRGKNHGHTIYKMARDNPDWFCSLLTVDDTRREDGTPVISPTDIEAERAEGMDEELIQQEYYVSFNSGMQGAYFAREMLAAEEDGRIRDVPYDPSLPVDTWWDLGVGDSTAIWFVQPHYETIRVIDYYETQGEGLPFYANLLDKKRYVYGEHIAPHDIEVRELGTGRSRKETARDLGIRFKVARKLPIDDGIQAVRMMLPMCYFDEKKTQAGRDALNSYRKEWDPKRAEFKAKPLHDWSSHAADAARTGAVGRKKARLPEKRDRYARKERSGRSWMAA